MKESLVLGVLGAVSGALIAGLPMAMVVLFFGAAPEVALRAGVAGGAALGILWLAFGLSRAGRPANGGVR